MKKKILTSTPCSFVLASLAAIELQAPKNRTIVQRVRKENGKTEKKIDLFIQYGYNCLSGDLRTVQHFNTLC